MGIKGSSTTAVYFDNVKVPVENVLGEIGRGHIIAFNILNLGRLKLGPFAHGGCRDDLAVSIRYAKERKAFGKSICRIRHDPAQAGRDGDPHVREREHDVSRGGRHRSAARGLFVGRPDAGDAMLKAVEEFATECSFIKVFASEMLDYVVDEGVQIHGGYGFHQDYAVEHAYRDSRINRIFEGHQRDQPAAGHRHAAEARAEGHAAAGGGGEETASGDPERTGAGRRDRHGREREEGWAARAGRGVSEISVRRSRSSRKWSPVSRIF